MTTVAERYDMFVDGQKCQAKSGKVHEILNPATNEVIAEIPAAGEADVNLAVASAIAANQAGQWRAMGPAERGEVLLRAADIIESRAEELGDPMLDTGIQVMRGVLPLVDPVDVFNHLVDALRALRPHLARRIAKAEIAAKG